MSPISLSACDVEHDDGTLHSTYKFNWEDATSDEKRFLKLIVPLLDGCQLYKKFSNRNLMKFREFDPILADKHPVESCGYGLRTFVLSRKLDKIEIRMPEGISKQGIRQRSGTESSIQVSKIRSPIIPRHTMEIVKTQKKQWLLNQEDEDAQHE